MTGHTGRADGESRHPARALLALLAPAIGKAGERKAGRMANGSTAASREFLIHARAEFLVAKRVIRHAELTKRGRGAIRSRQLIWENCTEKGSRTRDQELRTLQRRTSGSSSRQLLICSGLVTRMVDRGSARWRRSASVGSIDTQYASRTGSCTRAHQGRRVTRPTELSNAMMRRNARQQRFWRASRTRSPRALKRWITRKLRAVRGRAAIWSQDAPAIESRRRYGSTRGKRGRAAWERSSTSPTGLSAFSRREARIQGGDAGRFPELGRVDTATHRCGAAGAGAHCSRTEPRRRLDLLLSASPESHALAGTAMAERPPSHPATLVDRTAPWPGIGFYLDPNCVRAGSEHGTAVAGPHCTSGTPSSRRIAQPKHKRRLVRAVTISYQLSADFGVRAS